MMKNKLLIDKFPVLLGLLTGLFPCGWLYSFVILASQMTTLTESVLVIFIFWLTSLPAFLVFTGFIAQLIRKSPVSYQRISAIVLIAAGLFSILGHWAEYLKP
jgi:sulfite exporter TauE/SafE